jgi:endonuclease/exonuclease/phosphatase family metal-dependent hydrolase
MRAPFVWIGVILLNGCTTPYDEEHSMDVNDTIPKGPEATLTPISTGTFVFYNTENLYDTTDDPLTNDSDFTPRGMMHWDGDRYRRKLQRLALALSWTGSDLPLIIGLGEVENASVVRDLMNTQPLAKGSYEAVHRESQDERGIDVALLVRKRWAKVLAVEALMVRLLNDDTRDVLYVRLGLANKEQLHVFVNHWPSRREGEELSAPKRMAAARTVRERVDRLLAQDPDARIVIMGDLNDTPADPSIREGLRASATLNDEHADLFNMVALDPSKRPGSISHDHRWMYFDHLIVSRGMIWPKATRWRALSGAALMDERLIFRHPHYGDRPDRTFSGRGDYHPHGFSDHLPVVLLLGE